jgi:putative hydrolase of the HAD superfamily
MIPFLRCQAVIFDLFGTLVNNFSTTGYEGALERMALALALPLVEFKLQWYAVAKKRTVNTPANPAARIRYVCKQLGASCGDDRINMAVNTRYDYIRQVMRPRPGAREVLTSLKQSGLKTGLISDCSEEIPIIWPESPMAPLIDAAIFSCLVGLRKPDPRIYGLAAVRLDVKAESCLYIGDGGSQELSGARDAGMHPVLLRLDADSQEQHLISREKWEGSAIQALEEILFLTGKGES